MPGSMAGQCSLSPLHNTHKNKQTNTQTHSIHGTKHISPLRVCAQLARLPSSKVIIADVPCSVLIHCLDNHCSFQILYLDLFLILFNTICQIKKQNINKEWDGNVVWVCRAVCEFIAHSVHSSMCLRLIQTMVCNIKPGLLTGFAMDCHIGSEESMKAPHHHGWLVGGETTWHL